MVEIIVATIVTVTERMRQMQHRTMNYRPLAALSAQAIVSA